MLTFVRGDANGDGGVNISDPTTTLNHLFRGAGLLPCAAAGDSNADGQVDIADALFSLLFLFQAGADPAAPYPDCGASARPDDVALGCEDERGCRG